MPALKNAKHERFAQELAAGKTAHEAYVTAGFSPNGARGAASKLQSNANAGIRQRVAEILDQRKTVEERAIQRAVEKTTITKAWIMERLKENAERALQARAVLDEEGNPTGEYRYNGNVANRALELLGKELGMFIDRKEFRQVDEFADMSADDLRVYIANKVTEDAADDEPGATRH